MIEIWFVVSGGKTQHLKLFDTTLMQARIVWDALSQAEQITMISSRP